MSLFAPKTSVLEYYGTQIQSAVQALPIPIIYGAPRIPGNLIYANGFNAVKQSNGTKGGKGLFTGGKGTPSYLYYATLVIALGEGPITGIIVIYQDANVWFNLSNIDEINPSEQTNKSGQPNYIPTNATLFAGLPNQAPWDYVVSSWPGDARGYKDTCYVGLPNMQLDATATPPQLNWVPRGIFSGTSPLSPATYTGAYTNNYGEFFGSFYAGYVNADPALCIQDFLTNPVYGAGFPAALLDPGILSNTAVCFNPAIGDAALQTYCQAIGFAWSEVINNAESASSILDRWTKNMAVAIVWTGSTLKFIPYWDEPNFNNPGWGSDNPLGIGIKYYNPAALIQPIVAFTDDHFLQAQNPQEEPVTLDRTDPVDVYNYVRVSYRDRTNQFNENIAQDSDEAAIELYGPRIDNAQVAHEYDFGGPAQASATVQLRRNMSVRRRVTFRLAPEWAFFDPMDVVTVTSGPLTNFAVRIISLEEDDQGALTVIAEEFPAGAASPSIFAAPATLPPFPGQTNIPTHPINPPAIFEPPAALLAAEGQSTQTIVVGASSSNEGVADPNWGGCLIYGSADNETYTQLGKVTQPARQGVLAADLAAYGGTNPDSTDTLVVSLVESGGQLASTTPALAAQSVTLCAIIDSSGCLELLAFTTASLIGPNLYNLTGLYRGLYGTPAGAHLTGAQFLRVDSACTEATLPPQLIGQTLYLKMPSFNIYNGGEQDLSDPSVAVYTYVPNGSGFDPATNPIAAALMVGTPIDLNTLSSTNPPLDLNLGGNDPCAVTTFDVDLVVI